MTTESIDETTVGSLGDARVAMASIVRNGPYVLPGGKPARGTTCYLIPVAPEGSSILVGKGSIVKLGGALWMVGAVEIGPPGEGVVHLRQLG